MKYIMKYIARLSLALITLNLYVRLKLIQLNTRCLRLKLRYNYWRNGYTQAQASAAIKDSHDWVFSLSDEETHEIFKKVQAGEPLPYKTKVP